MSTKCPLIVGTIEWVYNLMPVNDCCKHWNAMPVALRVCVCTSRFSLYSAMCCVSWCLKLLCASLECLIGLSDHSDLCAVLLRVNRAVGEYEGRRRGEVKGDTVLEW